jgi:hypothetical protein
MKSDQREGLSVLMREFPDHRLEARGKFRTGFLRIDVRFKDVTVLSLRDIAIRTYLKRNFPAPSRGPVVICSAVARDLKEPGDQAIGAFQRSKAFVDSEEDLLEYILHVGLVLDPPCNERAHLAGKRPPDLFGGIGHPFICSHIHREMYRSMMFCLKAHSIVPVFPMSSTKWS